MNGTCTVEAVGARERAGLRRVSGERRLPRGLEVDGVDEGEAGRRREHAWDEQLRDAVLCLGVHPAIDQRAGLLGLCRVVDEAEPGAVAPGERFQVRLLQGHSLLGERGVGDPQRDREVLPALVLERAAPRGERLVERVQPTGMVVRGDRVHDRVHLRGGLAPRAGTRHRKGKRDARRREDHVRLPRRDRPVEVEAERVEGGARIQRITRGRGGARDLRSRQPDVAAGRGRRCAGTEEQDDREQGRELRFHGPRTRRMAAWFQISGITSGRAVAGRAPVGSPPAARA